MKTLFLIAALAGAAVHAAEEEPAYRFQAPIVLEQAGAFVRLPLSVAAHGHSRHADLRDLRIVDARGQRVPFALLPPRAAEQQAQELAHEATLYPLPPRPAGKGEWLAPVQVRVQGDRIEVVRAGKAAAPAASSARPGGWLIDTGERKADQPPPESLRLSWGAPAEFSVAFSLETSDDLRQWRSAPGGQLIALTGAAGALIQPYVVLPSGAGRFVRLAWADAATAPDIGAVQVIATRRSSKELDAPSVLTLKPGAQPAGKVGPDDLSARALHFDLGAVLPVVKLDLQLGAGTQVVPARLQARSHADEPWRELPGAVFYRLERGAEVAQPPALALQATARYLRIVPDARSATPDGARTQALVQVRLASLVFANQGQPPLALLAGAVNAATSALPVNTLVPALEEERARFGRASLGPFVERADVAQAEQSRERVAAMRPWLLWAVLIAGVAVLGYMVWRLARGSAPA